MRVKPSGPWGIAVAIGYIVLFGGLLIASGVDYDAVGDTAANARDAIVIPLAISTVVLVAVITALGWWKPVLSEERRVRGWLIAVPIVIVAGLLAGFNWSGIGDIDSELLLWLFVGTILVGFCEEVVYRGVALVGLRGSMNELPAWLISSVLFGLLHGANLFAGQALAPTIQQIVFAFVLGSGFYIARRATGLIVVPMVMHFMWDFSTFTQPGGGSAIASSVQTLSLLLVLVALVVGRHHLFARSKAADA